MPTDRKSGDLDAAATAYWRSVAAMNGAAEGRARTVPAAHNAGNPGVQDAETVRTVIEAAEEEQEAERRAASCGSTPGRPLRRMRRHL